MCVYKIYLLIIFKILISISISRYFVKYRYRIEIKIVISKHHYYVSAYLWWLVLSIVYLSVITDFLIIV